MTLNNRIKIPKLGLGTRRILNPSSIVYESIKKGCRLNFFFKYIISTKSYQSLLNL